MIDNKNFNGACRKAPFLFAFCKNHRKFYILSCKNGTNISGKNCKKDRNILEILAKMAGMI